MPMGKDDGSEDDPLFRELAHKAIDVAMDTLGPWAVKTGASWFLETAREFTAEIRSDSSSGIYDSLRVALSPSRRRTNRALKEVAKKDDDFVQWNMDFRSGVYSAEVDNRLLGLPYSYLDLWRNLSAVTLDPMKQPFRRDKGDADWNAMVEAGFGALKKKRDVFDKRDAEGNPRYAIRLAGYDPARGVMKVQKALYTDQAQSNLIADYREATDRMDIGQNRTLREALSRQHPGHLPTLKDRRLANTVGVSVMMLFRDEEGKLRPLVQLRDPSFAAMGNSGLHCTGSCAAIWPVAGQEMTAKNFFEDEALRSIEVDFGLTPDKIEGQLHLMGLMREHARLGKPQLFFYGLTTLETDEIVKFRLEKQYENEAKVLGMKGKPASDSKYATMTEGQFKDLILRGIWTKSNRSHYPFTHEADAMLAVLGHEFGDYGAA